jgi:cytochrome c556
MVSAALALTFASAVSSQTARTGRLMREKLQHSQRILAALVTSDYGLLQRETQALTAIAQSPEWSMLITPDLRPYTNEFTRALADLSAASGRRDYDSAGVSYGALTASCISCHKHVAKSRVAGTGPLP